MGRECSAHASSAAELLSFAGHEIACLLALCHFVDHLFPSAPESSEISPPLSAPAAPAAPSPVPTSGRKAEQAPRPQPSPARSQSPRPRPSPTSWPRIEVTDVSPRALDAHCKYCLVLLEVRRSFSPVAFFRHSSSFSRCQDPAVPGLVLGSADPTQEEALTKLAERIQRKRLKASRGSDSLDIERGLPSEVPAASVRSGLWAMLSRTFELLSRISLRLTRKVKTLLIARRSLLTSLFPSHYCIAPQLQTRFLPRR